MIKRIRFPRIFFGWWTAVGGGFLALWGWGMQAYSFSTLFKPISLELGFSRTAASVPAAISRLEGGLDSVVVGWLADKYGPRWIIIAGVLLLSLGLLLMYFVNSLWAFYVVWGVIVGMGASIALATPLDKAISNWFVKKRGKALGIKWVGNGLNGVTVVPLIAWFIATQGWRIASVVGGAVMLFVGLPVAWFCIKQHRPEYYGLLPDGATVKEETAAPKQMVERGVEYAAEVEEVEFTLRQAMRTPAYWLLNLGQASFSLAAPIVITHTVPLLTDMGIDPVKAAVMMGVALSSSVPIRFISGAIADRAKIDHLRFLLGGAYFLQAIGIAIFLQNQTEAGAWAFLIIYNAGFGLHLTAIGVARARYFGRKAYGSIVGSSMMMIAPVGVIAPIYGGWMYDTTGSYITAFITLMSLLTVGGVIMVLTRPPKPPAQITDIRKIV